MMDKKKIKKPLVVIGCCVAAGLLAFGIFRIAETNAELIESQNTDFELGTTHLAVHLVENGRDVCDQDNKLLVGLQDVSLDPGYTYDEKICARNTTDQTEYVRLIVKKYWNDSEGKRLDLDRAYIQLRSGKEDYNSSAWIRNDREHTDEQDVYYLAEPLAGNTDSALLFDGLRIADEVFDAYEFETNGNTITAKYKYDDMLIGLDMEVQSIQLEHADEAIKSAWGVSNVSISGGKLSVGQ